MHIYGGEYMPAHVAHLKLIDWAKRKGPGGWEAMKFSRGPLSKSGSSLTHWTLAEVITSGQLLTVGSQPTAMHFDEIVSHPLQCTTTAHT